jgi:hypothetical protein
MSVLADEIDYDNFKAEVARVQGDGSAYGRLLHRVWELVKCGR